MKRSRFFTVIVVPESSKSVHWTIPSVVAKVLVGLGGLFAIGTAAIFYDYIQLTNQVSENKTLRSENRQLAIQLQNLDSKIRTLDRRVDGMKGFRDKIAEFALLNDPDRAKTLAMGPIDPDAAEAELTRDVAQTNFGEPSDFTSYIQTASLLSNIDVKIRELSRKSQLEEQNIYKTYDIVQENKSLLRSMPSIKPTAGWITSTFGYRVSPYTGYKKLHDGLDIATAVGTVVVAPADGVVTFAGMKPGYGLVLVIDHGYGIETRYAHNSKFFVKPGDLVKRGTKITATGNTGLSTGPHLHYEVRINGIPIDPSKYILD